jgi:hypothetical protein
MPSLCGWLLGVGAAQLEVPGAIVLAGDILSTMALSAVVGIMRRASAMWLQDPRPQLCYLVHQAVAAPVVRACRDGA